ncbi:ATP-grasp domain-containing protein [Methylobacter sp.]|uniref:ATP-grasp domain-containing protein n=1 Tax=Methylobacter sp. TaxID=2051955 RepID=UPI002488DC3F|nr:ATP-grasp domain-containing protein [Methylobacter sp.]MDI1277403.1 ATP-grasp domain-containing protein [Methylobacter sp.]MDI1358010.1 ATP-grasp domain-containing protein [Methylobacter sp.]
MKILVFEYITGGGFNKQTLSDSLAEEGRLMRSALLDNLTQLNQTRSNRLEITVMMDWRLNDSASMTGINTVIIRSENDITEEFARLVKQCDLVWPIAPEFDGILQNLCQTVESLGKILLTSPATAVAIAGNKLKTYERLNRHHIAAVPTRIFENIYSPGEWMVKPVDGVGCADSYVLTTGQDFERMATQKGQYVMQPHLQGAKTSLSCLFKQGSGWLVCANLQRFEFIQQQYHLTDIVVNHHPDFGRYQPLIDKIARALPELWGYVGIDLIESDHDCMAATAPVSLAAFPPSMEVKSGGTTPWTGEVESRLEQRSRATQGAIADDCMDAGGRAMQGAIAETWVLEINPRLTTSFVGIYDALGINIAEAVLQLVHGEPILNPAYNTPITVQAQQETHAS